MKNKHHFIVPAMLCVAVFMPLQAQTITNVVAEQVGKTVEISYTLDKPTEISIEYSTDGTHYTKLKNVSGDVGENVQAGKKKIIWDALAETGGLVKDNVSFKIICGVTSVIDCQGHTYPVVKIGSQYWMAENLQCTKYDTQSERAGQTLKTSSGYIFAPYYTDGRYANTEYSGKLTQEQRKHLGLLYNWAAAMGYATGSQAKSQTGNYSGRRQGICPNGWHLPNRADWNTLANALGGVPQTNNYGYVNYSNVGAKLKSRSGWYISGWYIGNGTDDYGFSGLPAGFAAGSNVVSVGEQGVFWSSDAKNYIKAYECTLFDNCSDLSSGTYPDIKDCACSVRCLRD